MFSETLLNTVSQPAQVSGFSCSEVVNNVFLYLMHTDSYMHTDVIFLATLNVMKKHGRITFPYLTAMEGD